MPRLRKILPEGFTLVELLTVIAIIAILAAIVLNTAGYMQYKGACSRASTEIAAMSGAMENYKADNGDYPLGTNTNATNGTNSFLITALAPSNSKHYFEFSKGMLYTNASGSSTNVVDPFDNTYCYEYPGDPTNSGTNTFDLWSTANKPANPSAWIKNW